MAKFSLPFHTPLSGLKFLSFLINLLQLYYISSSCCFFLVSQYNIQFPQVYGKFFSLGTHESEYNKQSKVYLG